jgi:NAD(P)-dependent dehydrogenase (short-subunit alcohol dehydrogenase family)
MGLCDGRTAIVTGSGRGIGRSHALAFAAEGANVVVNDVDRDVAQAVVDEITAKSGKAIANSDDVGSWNGAEHMVNAAIEAFGRLDTLVCNAGNLRDRMLVNMTEEDWDSVLHVHLKGHFCPLRHAAAHWRDRSKAGDKVAGRVVFTTSGSGLFGNVGQANYVSAKAAIAILGRSAAAELKRYDVTVNVIGPVARTRMNENLERYKKPDEPVAFDALDPDNVSPLIVWLGSDDCDVSGEIFEATGGRLGIFEAARRGPWVEREERWTPAEIGPVARQLVAERYFVPVAGTPEFAAWYPTAAPPAGTKK